MKIDYVDEKNKIVYIQWNDTGQIGRYAIPYNVNKLYPGHTYKINNEKK